MKRLTEETVFSGLVTAWFFAALPTTRSPSLRKPSTDGVVRSPSAFTRISGSLPSMTAIAEFVVPKSIPRILDIMFPLLLEIVTVVSRGDFQKSRSEFSRLPHRPTRSILRTIKSKCDAVKFASEFR